MKFLCGILTIIFFEWSLREECFPGIVEAFQFISFDNSIIVGITVGVVDFQNGEELVGGEGWDLNELSIAVVVSFQIGFKFLGEVLVGEIADTGQPNYKNNYNLYLNSSHTHTHKIKSTLLN